MRVYIHTHIQIYNVYPPKNGEIALQTPRTSRLLDCLYEYSTTRPANEALLTLLV